MVELEKNQFTELSETDMMELDGGIFPIIVGVAGILCGAWVIYEASYAIGKYQAHRDMGK